MKLLFKDIEELQKYISVNISSDFLNIKESIRKVTRKYLYRAVSKKQYQKIIEKLEADKLTNLEKELLDHCRRIIANFSYADFIPQIQVQVSDAGIHIVSTDNKKTAFQWQIQDLQRSYIKTGYDAIEEVLEFLTENYKEFPIWHKSEAFSEATNCLINNAKTFDKYVVINENRLLFTEMKALMKRVERTRIYPICPKLFDKILIASQKDNLSEKYLIVLEMAQTALAKLTMSEFMKIKMVLIDEDGITTTSTNNTQTVKGKKEASPNAFSQARMLHEKQGELELANLVYYLKKHRREFAEVEEQYPEEQKKEDCCEKCHRHQHSCNCHKNKKIFHL